MQIRTTKLTSISPKNPSSHCHTSKPTEDQPPKDNFTFGYTSRRTKKKFMTAGAIAAGVGLGSVTAAHFSSSLAGTAAKVFGGVSGGVLGAAALGIAGIGLAAAIDDSEGMGGIAAGFMGMAVGATAGAVAGAYGGAVLGNGAGNVLGYGFGALAGGAVGGFAAKGMLAN